MPQRAFGVSDQRGARGVAVGSRCGLSPGFVLDFVWASSCGMAVLKELVAEVSV